jgi:hypothetical protein
LRRRPTYIQEIVGDSGPTVGAAVYFIRMTKPIAIKRPFITRQPIELTVRRTFSVTPRESPVVPTPPRVPTPVHENAIDAASPYVDYGRWLTAEGGILIVYKDLDTRFRHTLWRLFAWTISTGWEGWYVLHHSPVHTLWINLACLLAVAIINAVIVAAPVEIYRHVEIRPDCMILDGADVFWSRQMEVGWPGFQPNAEGNQVLCGIYGTRWVEYLTVRRFDEHDRMAEVFANHLQNAMQQLWTRYH